MHSQNPNSNLHLLPEDIIEGILSWMPVKSLLKFRCVSKSWLSLIKSDRFIKIHFQTSTKKTTLAHHRIVGNKNLYEMNGRSLASLFNSKEGSSNSVIDLEKTGCVVGSCNGMLCLCNYIGLATFLVLWNPATRVSIELPKLNGNYRTIGFGWDESSGAFKVFASTDERRIGLVYSSKTNSWNLVSASVEDHDSPPSPFGVFVGGRIHWALGYFRDDEHVIESFDLENEQFGRIELPFFNANAYCWTPIPGPRLWLGEIGGCLCTMIDSKLHIVVWVMKEYGVKDSWFKLLTFSLDVDRPQIWWFVPLLGEGPNGEIFIIYGHILKVYSPKDDDFYTASRNMCCFGGARIYVESLITLTAANTT